jgi:hypothetical protein
VEHVAFLIEESGALIRCLLNPETLVVRRLAGVRTRQPTGGRQASSGQLDDLIFFTGGGHTELELDLLFDIDLSRSSIPGISIPAQDVRDLTGPIWKLAENSARGQDTARPPQVRFLWGKAWNIPGVVLAIAERFESFTSSGIARRSWLRMRILRVNDIPPKGISTKAWATPRGLLPLPTGENLPGLPGEQRRIYQPLSLSSRSEEQPTESLPEPTESHALPAQALRRNPDVQQAQQEMDQAIDTLVEGVFEAGSPPGLKEAVEEMQAAKGPMAPDEVTPSLFETVVRIGAAQAAAINSLANLPGIEKTKNALVSLTPALDKLGLTLAKVAGDALKSSAIIAAEAAEQISKNVATTLNQISSSIQKVPLPGVGQPPGAAERDSGLIAALKDVEAVTEKISHPGDVSRAEVLQERLDGIGALLNTDWAQNNPRQVHKLMQALWLAHDNLQAAEAVRQATSPGVLLKKAVDYLRTCLPADQAGAQLALRRLEAIAQFILTLPENRSDRDAIKESANQVRQGLEILGDPEKNKKAHEFMKDALNRLEKIVEIRLESEAAQIAGHACGEANSMPDEWHGTSERLDQIAYRFYGHPAYWRLLAQANQIDNPLKLAPDQPLVIPPIPRGQAG